MGYNYRLSEVNCALGLAQMERLEELLRNREQVARLYHERLEPLERRALLERPYTAPHVKVGWFVYVVRLGKSFTREDRDRVLRGLRERGIGCANYFPPIHLQPFYREMFGYKPGDFPVTEAVSERTIALPFHPRLTEAEVDSVVQQLEALLQ